MTEPKSESIPRFHLAFPVDDLETARGFYAGVLGCEIGREAPGSWIDFNLCGHQIVAHYSPEACAKALTQDVDGKQVPVFHFGLILPRRDWEGICGAIDAADIGFLIAPTIRFEGKRGEQRTFFVLDPAGNGLEFKSFADEADIFARDI